MPQARLPVERTVALRPSHKVRGYACMTQLRKMENMCASTGTYEYVIASGSLKG